MAFVWKFRLALLLIIASLAGQSCRQPLTTGYLRQQRQTHVSAEGAGGEVTFIAVGDIMLSRGVARIIGRANDPHLPFSRLSELLSSTDFNFGNLESPFSGRDEVIGKGLVFNARRRELEGLAAHNFKVLNLANNHALDQGPAGLRQTRKFLEAKGIEYLGVGDDQGEAWRPKVVNVRGIKVGFIGASYSSYNDGGTARNEYVARIENVERLRTAIRRLKSEADFVVVTMHAGTEYVRSPNQSQVSFARAAIDYGADLVVGTHPHWIQTAEYYNGRCIFYSLGNFIFDQGFSHETKQGLVLRITLASRGGNEDSDETIEAKGDSHRVRPEVSARRIELIPVIIENYSTPRRATDAEAQQILQKIDVPSQCSEAKDE